MNDVTTITMAYDPYERLLGDGFFPFPIENSYNYYVDTTAQDAYTFSHLKKYHTIELKFTYNDGIWLHHDGPFISGFDGDTGLFVLNTLNERSGQAGHTIMDSFKKLWPKPL